MSNLNVQPISWPSVTLTAGQAFTFRLTYAAHFQLARWGKNLATASMLELAAACAGEFVDGKWRSHGFERVLDLADMMDVGDEIAITEAVVEAVKKAVPEAEVSVQASPAETNALA